MLLGFASWQPQSLPYDSGVSETGVQLWSWYAARETDDDEP